MIEVASDDAVDFALAWRSDVVSETNPDISISLSEDLSEVTLTWESIPGRTYAVEQSDGLTNWTTVPGMEAVTAGGSLTSVTFGIPAPDRMFFRVVDTTP